MANTGTDAMKLAAIMLIAFTIPANLGGQQINGAEKLGQETPVQSSPDDPSKPRPTLGTHHLPATTSPDGCWTVTPLYHNGKFVSYEWTEKVDPPVPPQPPAPPKPPPSPVPPVVPTPQCQVVYVCSTPVAPAPCTMYAPVGYYPAPRGCGFHPFRAIGRALFGWFR